MLCPGTKAAGLLVATSQGHELGRRCHQEVRGRLPKHPLPTEGKGGPAEEQVPQGTRVLSVARRPWVAVTLSVSSFVTMVSWLRPE